MRVIGLDIGAKRIGVAISDPTGSVATPVAVLDAAKAVGDGRELATLMNDYEVALVVVGLPLSMDGTEGPQAALVRSTVNQLAQRLSVPIEFADERLSSVEAKRRMRESGVTEKESRGRVDMVAAAIFLQGYLDSRSAADGDAT